MIPIPLFPHESRALAAGKLGVLIRVVEPQPVLHKDGFWVIPDGDQTKTPDANFDPPYGWAQAAWPTVCNPFGPPGSTLECREEWAAESSEGTSSVPYYHSDYVDDGDLPPPSGIKWQPADSMPSWAVRFHPVVGEVRCVRAGDLTVEQMKAWGLELVDALGCNVGYRDYLCAAGVYEDPRNSAWSLFDSIHGPGSWEANLRLWLAAINTQTGESK